MEFDIKKNPEPNKERYTQEEFDIAYKFTKDLKKEFHDFIRGVVLFGSVARNSSENKSDIDILIIVDDVNITLTAELVESYRILVEKVIEKVSKRLHITSLKYSTFWDYIRIGDPVGLNILREGVPLIDTGFFKTLQLLLKQGRIKPSAESVWTYFSRAPSTLINSKWHIMQGALDLYWAVVDAGHALMMKHDMLPPAPEIMADVMKEKLVKENIIDSKHADTVKEFYLLSKQILHRNLKELSGKDYDEYYRKAYDFITTVKEKLEKEEKK